MAPTGGTVYWVSCDAVSTWDNAGCWRAESVTAAIQSPYRTWYDDDRVAQRNAASREALEALLARIDAIALRHITRYTAPIEISRPTPYQRRHRYWSGFV